MLCATLQTLAAHMHILANDSRPSAFPVTFFTCIQTTTRRHVQRCKQLQFTSKFIISSCHNIHSRPMPRGLAAGHTAPGRPQGPTPQRTAQTRCQHSPPQSATGVHHIYYCSISQGSQFHPTCAPLHPPAPRGPPPRKQDIWHFVMATLLWRRTTWMQGFTHPADRARRIPLAAASEYLHRKVYKNTYLL